MSQTSQTTVAAVREIVLVGAMLATAVALAFTDNRELAATALGGALGMAMPGIRNAPASAIVLGLGAGALVNGMI